MNGANVHIVNVIICITIKGGETTTKWSKMVHMATSNHHILGSLTSLGLKFRHVSSIEGFYNF